MNERFIKEIYNCNYMTKEEKYDILNKLIRDRTRKGTDYKPILTPLNIEVAINNKIGVFELLKNKVDVNEVNDNGYTTLWEAVWLKNYQMAEILLDNFANVNGNDKYIPLLMAALKKDLKMIKLLLDNGADIQKKDENGFNALQYLFPCPFMKFPTSYELQYFLKDEEFLKGEFKNREYKKNLENCVELLIASGIDVNYQAIIKNFNKNVDLPINALSLALEKREEEAIKKLLDLGANKEVFEIDPSDIYAYQDSFDIYNLKSLDFSECPAGIVEYFEYLKYKQLIKKYNLKVYTITPDDGYKRVKKLIKTKGQ